jgi:hypothetical protein
MPKKSKKKKQEEIDESELEKEILEEESLQESEDFFEEEDKFVERVNLPSGVSPVLERIAETQEIQQQVQDQTLQQTNVDSERQIDYANLIVETYRNYETVGTTPVLRPVEREIIRSENLLDPFAGMGFRQSDSQNMRIESEFTEGRHKLPFEREEKKYKKVKL